MQRRETARQARNAAARGLHFHGNRDGVTVVFDQVEQRKLFGARGVERFPKFAFAGGAVATGNVDDLIGFVAYVFAKRRFFGLRQSFRAAFVVQRCFRSADGLYKLRAGTRRFGDNVELRMSPVRGHLPSARGRVILRAYGLQQHFQRRDTHHQAKRAVAVIRIQPIDSGTQKQPHGGGHAFMAGAGDLEVNLFWRLS